MAHGINQRLVFDYQQFVQKPFSLACSAFKSCYDRIVHSDVSLALPRLGITLPSIISMLDTIQRMPNKVRKSYGDSNLTYVGETIPDEFRHFMIGLCQRNGIASLLWSIITSTIFSALLTQGFGIHFVNSFSE